MNTLDFMFRLKRSLPSIARGFLKIINTYIFHPQVSIKMGLRIGRGSSLVFHPGCRSEMGYKLTIGGCSTLSVGDRGHLSIGSNVGVGFGNQIICMSRVKIGDGTIMGPNVMIFDHDHIFNSTDGVRRLEYKTAPITIGKNCWLGAGVTILKGTIIGDNCLIAAGAVIKGDYASGSIVIQKRIDEIKRIN